MDLTSGADLAVTETVERQNHSISADQVMRLLQLPFPDLLYKAQTIHRENFNPCAIQLSILASIKTGGCPEDCGYCSQSAHHKSGLKASRLLDPADVIQRAVLAQAAGATRFCLGAAWRQPHDREMETVCQMIRGVKNLGLETCATLGMLTEQQAIQLAEAGLDYYNHNLDTSRDYYPSVVSTRSYDDRLGTLATARRAGMRLCCGGIFGMGESAADRAGMIATLANLPAAPESVPLNLLVPIEGTPLSGSEPLEPLEFVRLVAAARICLPKSHLRLSAGRNRLSDEAQALCFLAGANSVFIGDQLLTTPNRPGASDTALLDNLGLKSEQ